MAVNERRVTIDGLAPFTLEQIGRSGDGGASEFGYALRDGQWFVPYANGVNDDPGTLFTHRVTLTSRTEGRPPGSYDDLLPSGPDLDRFRIILDTFGSYPLPDTPDSRNLIAPDPDTGQDRRVLAIYDTLEDRFLYYFEAVAWPPPWTLRGLDFDGAGMVSHITDSAIPGDRLINDLRLGPAGGSVTLTHTMVVHIHGPGDAPYAVTLGAATTRSVELGGGADRVAWGTGFVRQIATGGGNDSVTGGDAGAQLIDLGAGANTLVAGTGVIGAVVAGGGADAVVAGAGARIGSLALGSGADRVTLAGDARVESLRLSGRATLDLTGTALVEQALLDGPQVRVTLADAARILQLRTGAGQTRLTTDEGYLDSFTSVGGSGRLDIGTGGAGSLTFADPAGPVALDADGFIGTLQVLGDAAATVTLRAGADQIRTGGGDDRVTAEGAAYVGTLRTGDGDDRVTLGAAGARFVDLGLGDDVVRLAVLPPGDVSILVGGAGVDTVDFALVGVAVTVDLSLDGAVQAIGGAGAAGFLALSAFETLIGTAFADALTGDAGDNRLAGGAGADVLAGNDGADTLAGGTGDDRLTGGTGADLFVFARRDGRDRVADFEPGLDRIAIAGVAAPEAIAIAETATGVRLRAAGTVIDLDGVTAAEMADPGNYLF